MKNSGSLNNKHYVIFFLAILLVCFCLWLLHAELREISPDQKNIAFNNKEQNEILEEWKKKTLRNPHRKTHTTISGYLHDKNSEELTEDVTGAFQVITHSLSEFASFNQEYMDGFETFEHKDGYSLISFLVEMVQTNQDPEIRIRVLEQLADTYEEFPLARLSEALNDPDMLVIEEALDIIKKLKIDELVTAIAMVVKDDDPYVRLTALETFETLQEFEPIDDIAEYPSSKFLAEMALTDPQPKFRMIALELLAEAGQEVALEPLNHALNDPDPGVSELALDLIVEFEEKWQG
jgi:hypothetical protein